MTPSGKSPRSAKNAQPWWQKGIFSSKNAFGRFFQKIISKFLQTKESIPEDAMFAYKQALMEIGIFGKNIDILHKEDFLRNQEFCILVKLRYLLDNHIEEYAGIDDSIQLLRAAIEAKDSFAIIDQTESRFRGGQQQKFYQFVEVLLDNFQTTEDFRQQLDQQLTDTLKLLSLFKTYNLADYSLLRQVSDLVQQLSSRDLRDYESLKPLIITNYSAFENLGKIINLPPNRSNPDTFMRMTQVLALDYKYQFPFIQISNLLMVIKRWYQPYQVVIAIREQYPPHKYQQPEEFTNPIPGESTFLKYKDWLTEKTTGVLFIDLGNQG